MDPFLNWTHFPTQLVELRAEPHSFDREFDRLRHDDEDAYRLRRYFG